LGVGRRRRRRDRHFITIPLISFFVQFNMRDLVKRDE
jgi:hypothetical protein